jgi:flagellar hook-basal body complex protein FliE
MSTISSMMGALRDLKQNSKMEKPAQQASGEKPSFMDHLKTAIDEVNQDQLTADKKATDLANGKDTNIHETMLASSQAELSFNMMVQVRNKALSAYQEIMRMPI